MNRTLCLKLLWLAALLVAATGSILLVTSWPSERRALAGALVALAWLTPGRVQGLAYRELFRGRRLLDAEEPARAIEHLERFLADIRSRPWTKGLLWLSWSVYTVDAEAMAWNNLGAALTRLGRWPEATGALEAALYLDPEYPLPHFNLGLLAALEGRPAEVERRLRAAATLGYARSTTDGLVAEAQALLARVEG